MSELEHIDLVSIHSLLTTKALSDAGRSSLSREGEARIAAADVIFAHDTDTGQVRGVEPLTPQHQPQLNFEFERAFSVSWPVRSRRFRTCGRSNSRASR